MAHFRRKCAKITYLKLNPLNNFLVKCKNLKMIFEIPLMVHGALLHTI